MQTRSHGNNNLQQLAPRRRPRNRIQQLLDGFEAMADNPQQHHNREPNTVGMGDTANANADRQGIHAPRIENNNFEVRIGLINMVQQNRFHGLPAEDPLDHIDQFNKLLDLLKINGVSEDALKLRLFPFSLGDKAHTWETNLPPGSITTWDACKKAFLAKFFSPVRTAKLRNDISSFKQLSTETFHDAWERFRALTHQCPHHGFSEATLLSTLYRGALPRFRQLLDTASNGSFLAKDVEEAMQLVENLAQSDAHYGEDYDRRVSSDAHEEKRDKEIKALNEKLDKQVALMDKQNNIFDKLLTSKKEQHHVVHSVEDYTYEGDGDFNQEMVSQEEMNYVGNQEYKFRPHHPNLSYTNSNVANPNDVSYPQRNNQGTHNDPPMQGQQQRPQANYQGNQAGTQQRSNPPPPGFQQNQRYGNQQRIPGQGQQNYGYQGQRYNNQQGYNQASHGFVNQPLQGYPINVNQGYPHATTQANAQGDLVTMMQQMLTGQSALNTRIGHMEDEIKHLKSQGASSSKQGQLPGKAETNPKTEYINAIELRSGTTLHSPVHPNEAIGHLKGGVDLVEKNVFIGDPYSESLAREYAREDALREEKKLAELNAREVADAKKPKYVPPPPYVPPLPYPGRFKKQSTANHKAIFDKTIKNVEVTMPLIDALVLVPQHAKFIKDLVIEQSKEVESTMVLTHEASAIITKQESPKKLEDPGSFTIPCDIGSFVFPRCLCDLGASGSLMPLSVAKRLGVTKFKGSNMRLILADRSVRTPIGVVEDIPVMVQGKTVPTDFIVLDIDEEPNDPIIFGRPFLATAGAVIDVKQGKIDLHLSPDEILEFDINQSEKKPTTNGQCFSLEAIEDKADKNMDDNEKSIMEIERLLFGSHEYDLMGIDKEEGAAKVEIQPSKTEYMGGYSSIQIASPQKQEVKDAKGGFYTTNLEKTSDAPFFLFGPSTGSMRVTPWKIDNGSIEHKMKNKKKAKPFAKVKAMLTSKLKEKGKGELQRIVGMFAEHQSRKPPWSALAPNLSIN